MTHFTLTECAQVPRGKVPVTGHQDHTSTPTYADLYMLKCPEMIHVVAAFAYTRCTLYGLQPTVALRALFAMLGRFGLFWCLRNRPSLRQLVAFAENFLAHFARRSFPPRLLFLPTPIIASCHGGDTAGCRDMVRACRVLAGVITSTRRSQVGTVGLLVILCLGFQRAKADLMVGAGHKFCLSVG